jgi:signal transduction histidine kinase/CheY-like chemotaxis protein/streptogramin lyase
MSYVLQLDGDGSHLRLRPDIFNDLEEATVECWVKWQRLSHNAQPFGFGRTWQLMGVHNGARTQDLVFFVYEHAQKLHAITVPDVLQVDVWYHIAMVTGRSGMRAYINGVLAGEDEFTGSFAAIANGEQNSLGASFWPENQSFFGQIAHPRIWRVARTAAQIAESLHESSVEGADLIARWDFSDGDTHDRSGNGFDGELVGSARLLSGRPPTSTETRLPAILRGCVTDDASQPVAQAELRLQRSARGAKRAQTDAAGRYQMVIWEADEGGVDLAVTHGDLGGWHQGLILTPGESQQVDLVLREAVCIEGTLLALDNTPHAMVVVQALYASGHRAATVAATTMCDGGGRYSFSNLPSGLYDLRCHAGHRYVTEAGLRVEPGSSQAGVDFRFAPFKVGTWRSYKTIDGLVHNMAWSACAAADGRLWVGTVGGVCCFDGAAFTELDFGGRLLEYRIRSIHQSGDGVLWFGTDNEGAWCWDGISVSQLSSADGLPHNEVRAICSTASGDLFFGTADGLARRSGKDWTHFTTRDGLADQWIWSLHCDAEQILWIGTNAGLSRFDGQQFTSFTTRDGLVDNRVTDITHDAQGDLWIATHGGVSHFDGRNFVNYTPEDGLINELVLAVRCDRHGGVWLGTWRGASHFDGERFSNFTTEDGLLSDFILGIEVDEEGVLWFATEGGLCRFDDDRLRVLSSRHGLAHTVVSMTCTTQGEMWFGTELGVYRHVGGPLTHFASKQGVVGERAFSITDSAAGVLCGTESGICRFTGERFVADEEIRGNYIFCIFHDRDGVRWVGSTAGVTRHDAEGVTSFTREQGLADDSVRAIGQDREGLLWFGTVNGLSSYDGTRFHTYDTQDGLVHNRVFAIELDADGCLWFATGAGLGRFDGRDFSRQTTANGLAHNDVQAMKFDADGLLWVGGLGGVVSFFDGTTWTSLDSRDGLVGSSIRAIEQDAEGFMWFGTDRGAIRYRRNTATNPAAVITAVHTDVRHTDLHDLRPLIAGMRATIEYTSIDFRSSPERRQYRCRISGAEWSTPTVMTRFEWTPPEPGDHLFEVQAIDQDLNYSEPVQLNIPVHPEPQREALRRTRRELEQAYRTVAAKNEELEARGRELQQARDHSEEARKSADSANRAKSMFLANMSHEIRTPMNAMLGNAQILLRDKGLDESQRRSVERVEQSGQHLLSLIDEVLDISRIEAGRQPVQETDFDLITLLSEISLMFEVRCAQKDLSWSLQGPVSADTEIELRGDAGKLRQILSNLLSNAVKFTRSGGVWLRVSQEQAYSILFEVEDSGPGLTAAEQQQVFEPFHQGQSAPPSEGAGLGLAIAQRLVELLGGRLQLDSAPDRGARFFFTLVFHSSLRPVAPQLTGKRVIGLSPGCDVHALVVDDLEENRHVIDRLLQSIGCRVDQAASGFEALTLMGSRKPDIVFMDIRMPGMSGVEAAERVWDQFGRIPVVAVSASALSHERERYLRDGFAGFVAKPVRFEQLCQCLAAYLQVEFDYEGGNSEVPMWAEVDVPETLLLALREAAEQGEVTRLRVAVDELGQLGAAQRGLAVHLDRLGQELDLAGIRAALRQAQIQQ